MLGGRTSWLARPWFLVAVATLAVNDHMLKQAWPGWLTGKLSDIAGVVVVGTIASVLLGASWGTVVTGVGFAALKTVPGVAEAAAPLLGGGVTLRDASDLVAVLALPSLWLGLRRNRPGQADRNRRGWAVVGLLAAVLACSASQPRPEDGVHGVVFQDGGFLVDLSTRNSPDVVVRSTDAGRSWSPAPEYSYAGVFARGEDRNCARDRTCYWITRTAEGCSLDRLDASGWHRESGVPGGCPAVSAVAVDPDHSGRAVALAGTDGVAFRDDSGAWTYVDVLQVVRGPRAQQDLRAAVGSGQVTLALSVALTVLVGLGFRSRLGRVFAILVVWLAVPPVLFLGAYGHPQDNADWNTLLGGATAALALAVLARAGLRSVRRSRAPRPGAGFDPPNGAR